MTTLTLEYWQDEPSRVGTLFVPTRNEKVNNKAV